MFTALTSLRNAASMYARYRQTRDAIANMPLDVSLDLDIYRGDADRIAREAVFGRKS